MKLIWKRETRKVKDLLPADYNPRKMSPEQRQDLENSIKEFGAVVPVVVNIGKRKNRLIGGHQRVTIYADLGIDEIDVQVPNRELTLQEEQRLNLRLNKNVGSWDMELLANLEIETLMEVGFGDEELSSMWDDVEMDDDNFDVQKAAKEIVKPKSRPGDIYELGNHRLMCGDPMDHEQVEKLMGAHTADIVYIDPPKAKTSKNDQRNILMSAVIDNAITFASPNAHFFTWCDENEIGYIQSMLKSRKLILKNVCMWIKHQVAVNHKQAFNNVYAPCVYAVQGLPLINKTTNKVLGILNKGVDADNNLHDEMLDMVTLWVEKHDSLPDHPEQKPVTLAEKPLKRCSAPGHRVLDLFAGGGAILIACEQIGRKAYLMEKDPVYVDVIIKRYEQHSNKKAKKL